MPKAVAHSVSAANLSVGAELATNPQLLSQSRRDARKLLFVTGSDEYGGTEKHLLELLQTLSGCGVELSILCTDVDCYSERLRHEQSPDVQVFAARNLKSFWDWFRIFRDTRPDVLVLVKPWMWCFPWYTCLVAWLAGIPRRFSIVHLPPMRPLPKVGGWSVQSARRLFRRARYRLSHWRLGLCCSGTICVSDAIRNCLVSDCLFPAARTITIPNGIVLSQFEPAESKRQACRLELGLKPDEFLLVCVARLGPQKRIDILLTGMEHLFRMGYRCRCMIVGDGTLRDELLEQGQALGLADHISFVGFKADVRPYLYAADAFILTSQTEGMPLSVLEAMACGLPCIVTDVGGNAEVVTHSVNGLVISPGSVEAVAEAISYLISHPYERLGMSGYARTRACEEFDIKRRMAEIERVILT